MVLDLLLQINPPGANEVENYLGSYVRVIDILLAFFILWGAYKGWQKGFIVELISTMVFIFGVLLIFFAVTQLFMATDKAVGEAPKLAKFASYFLLYMVSSLALNKMSRILQFKIDYSVFDSFDNFLAMLLGGIKYAIFLSIFLGLLNAAGLRLGDSITSDTKIYPLLLDFQVWLVKIGAILAPTIGEMNEYISRMLSAHT